MIEITQHANFLGQTKPTPIVISGFTGEVASALRFDLTVMGFIEAGPDTAQYVLSGSNNGNVQGQLSLGSVSKTSGGAGTINGTTRSVLFSKSYNGASIRAQAHRLADDVVLKITGVNGIAETKIAFKAEGGRGSEIYIADYDGHNAQAVTRDGTIVAAPCWVPGRLALYYTSYKLGTPNIFYQNLSSGERRNFAHYGGMNSSAAVSTEGRVAMVLGRSGSPDIYVCNADGTGLKDLTPTREDESSPCWSPDGQWVCYAGKAAERRSLFKVSGNGGAPQRIPTSGVSSPSEPDWSPDGKWIVFTSQHAGGFDICVVPAQGGLATVLVAGEDACWAPNSRNVVYARRSGNGGSRVLAILDVPTKQTRDCARVSGSDSQPSWAR